MDYYQLLGVDYSATQNEIKRAYRRLAVMYHPDKNPDPAAENIFKNINEAYDVLGDPAKKRMYDGRRLQSPYEDAQDEPPTPRHRDPAYRFNRYKVFRKGDRERMHDLMETYLPWALRITQFCFAFSLLIMVDYFLPYRINQETIIGTAVRRIYSGRNTTSLWVIETDRGHTIALTYEFSDHFTLETDVNVYSSLLFDVPRKIESEQLAVRLKKSIYGNFVFAPSALLFFSALGLFYRKNIEYGFNLSVTSFLILILTVVLILIL